MIQNCVTSFIDDVKVKYGLMQRSNDYHFLQICFIILKLTHILSINNFLVVKSISINVLQTIHFHSTAKLIEVLFVYNNKCGKLPLTPPCCAHKSRIAR